LKKDIHVVILHEFVFDYYVYDYSKDGKLKKAIQTTDEASSKENSQHAEWKEM
jgi:hypothetical protein